MGIRGIGRRIGTAVVAVGGLLALAAPALADSAARETAARHLEAGTLAAGDAELSALLAANPGNEEARYGLGMIRFVAAVEHLSQGLYRYGLEAPDNSTFVVRLPVPHNPSPEPVTYEAFRGILAAFSSDLAKADETLAGLGEREVKVPVDLAKVRYDANGDGKVTDDELLIVILDRMTAGFSPAEEGMGDLSFVVGFDRADAYWLRGYSNALMAVTEFWLGYDFHQTFELTFHRFFPASPFAFQDATAAHVTESFLDSYELADVITLIHTINWPVAEPDRLLAALGHLKQMITLSRQNWDAIEAETDDDHEWLPNPRQAGVLGIPVTEAQIGDWHRVLADSEAALNGTKLVGHWRMQQGFNLRLVFEQPQNFDLVLWIAGPGALPYLEAGPVMQAEEWTDMMNSFGGAFPLYLFWFN